MVVDLAEKPIEKIVVPAHLRRLYESAMQNYDEAHAIETARNICSDKFIDAEDPDRAPE